MFKKQINCYAVSYIHKEFQLPEVETLREEKAEFFDMIENKSTVIEIEASAPEEDTISCQTFYSCEITTGNSSIPIENTENLYIAYGKRLVNGLIKRWQMCVIVILIFGMLLYIFLHRCTETSNIGIEGSSNEVSYEPSYEPSYETSNELSYEASYEPSNETSNEPMDISTNDLDGIWNKL